MMKFYIADAFTDRLFGGNPAGIIILDEGRDFPDDAICVRTAAELRYSETVFIKRLESADGIDGYFHFRYFAPTGEVDLCGHATIAAFSVLSEAGAIMRDGVFRIRTLAGDLEINVQRGFVMMNMGIPEISGTLYEETAIEELYGIMGLKNSCVMAPPDCHRDIRLFPSIISTGLPDIIMPVGSLSQLNSITPDFNALAALSRKYDVIGVHAFTLDKQPDEEGVRAHTRNFAPLVGIDEEAATGTSSGALTYYLYLNGIISDDTECLFIQGEAMGRPSKIYTRINKLDDGSLKIKVGGTGVTLASGEIYIQEPDRI